MGYAFQVTPLQLAAAYGALANGGILLTPTLVREIRDARGKVIYRHRPEPVRRAVPQAAADTVLAYLKAVVGKGGTAEGAQIAEWTLVGKTGTAQRFDGTSYQKGHYNASFASIFPYPDPQLVVLVKINEPHTKFYGGETAAPLTRTMLLEALTARRSALDRNRPEVPVVELSDSAPGSGDDEPEESRVVLQLPLASDSTDRGELPIPNVAGANVRRAVSTLHQRGFRVAVRGSGRVDRTTPKAGESAGRGSTVTVWAE
jgi:cell division protein FtsI (penicillin-binding protein 3)